MNQTFLFAGHKVFSVPQSLSKPVHMTDVVCSNSALTLLECNYSLHSGYYINNITDTALSCNHCKTRHNLVLPLFCDIIIATCTDGDLRLAEGTRDTDGKLEMCFNSRWTSAAGEGWMLNNTIVACRQLGYTTSGSLQN